MLPRLTPKQRQRANALIKCLCPIMTAETALRWMTENPAPVCIASHTHFSASISAKLFCRQSLCWKRIFLAHALKSACPAVRRLSRRATERNIARSALKELTKLSRQSTQEENGQSRKIGTEKASNIKAFQLPHFEGQGVDTFVPLFQFRGVLVRPGKEGKCLKSKQEMW